MIEKTTTFDPDWVSPPGDTISDLIEERGWTQTELATRIGCTTKHLSLLINGKVPISDDIAIKLATVLGATAEFWLTREAHFRAKKAIRIEKQALDTQADWLGKIPVNDMVKFGWVQKHKDPGEQVAECLRFFGVASTTAWELRYIKPIAAFRVSSKCEIEPGAVVAWLRQGERKADSLDTQKFDNTIFKETLRDLRSLTRERDPKIFVPNLVGRCAKSGVAVAIEPAPRGCPLSGATRWLTQDKALLMLSLRYKSNDQFWFSFFHEAAHLLLHGKKLLFLETEGTLNDHQEAEADAFARDLLIPPHEARLLKSLGRSSISIVNFASRIGVDPGIVVGRMQKEGFIPWTHLHGLKVRYKWVQTGNR